MKMGKIAEKLQKLRLEPETQKEDASSDKLSFFQRGLNLLSRAGQIAPKIIEQKVYSEENPEQSVDKLKALKTLVTGELEESQKDIPIAQLAEQLSLISAAKTLLLGKPTKSKLSTTAAALEKAGVPELGSLDISTKDPFTTKLSEFEQSQGRPAIEKKPYRITGRDVVGFASDVALDPSTYIGGGVAKGAIKVGETALSSAGKKALQGMAKKASVDIGQELAEKGISKTAQELAEAGEKKAFRDMAKLLPVKKEFVDRGGVKFAGKTIVPRETIERASSAVGGVLDKVPGVAATKQTVKGLFQRDALLPEKAKGLMQDYYNKVDYKTAKVVDNLKDALKVGDAPVSEQQRRTIFGALTKAEDESSSLFSRAISDSDEMALSVKEQIKNISKLADDPDFPIEEFKKLQDQLPKKKGKIWGELQKDFDKILYKNISSLPKELQEPARKIALSLKQAAKRDAKAVILTKFIPNYVPRKYIDLDLATKGPSTGVGGTLIKTLGGRAKARKIGSTEEARKFAESKGGELVEDISIPVAERLIRGEKAIAGRQLVDRFKQEFGKKDYTGKVKLPVYIEKHLQQINSRGVSDEATNNLLKTYDKYLNFHKGYLTGISPKFHARNIVSNRFMSALGSGANAIDPRVIKRGWDLGKGKSGEIVTDLGKTVSYDELRDQAKRFGASKGYFLGDINQTIPEMLGTKKVFSPVKIGRKVGQAIEDADRMGLFATFVKQGKSYKQAAEEVNKFLFDYNNLSNFEKSVMKRLFPFYTFSRKALGLFSEQLVKQPRTFASIPDFVNFLSQEDLQPQDMAKLPDYLQSKVLINVGNNQVLSGLDLGFEQLLETSEDPEKLLSQLSPPLKVILENFSNKNYFRGSSLDEAAKNITDIPKPMLKLLAPVIGLSEDKKTIYKDGRRTGAKKIVYNASNPKTLNIIRNLPISRIAGESAAIEKPGESLLQKAIKTLTGYRVQDVDPGLIKYLKKKEDLKKLEQEGKVKKFEKYYIPRSERGNVDLKTRRLVR